MLCPAKSIESSNSHLSATESLSPWDNGYEWQNPRGDALFSGRGKNVVETPSHAAATEQCVFTAGTSAEAAREGDYI